MMIGLPPHVEPKIYHDHLDVCHQCRTQPFNNCPVGQRRLERSVNQGEPTKGYEIAHDGKAIKCLSCEMTSHNPTDVKERFCGKCNKFHVG